MKTVRMVVCSVFIMAVGCAGALPPENAPSTYPHYRSFSNLSFAWNTLRGPDAVRVSGVVRNVNYERLRDLVLTVSVRDAGGVKLGEKTYIFASARIEIDESLAFDMNIPVTPGKTPAVLEFVSRYRFADREMPDALNSQAFEDKLP